MALALARSIQAAVIDAACTVAGLEFRLTQSMPMPLSAAESRQRKQLRFFEAVTDFIPARWLAGVELTTRSGINDIIYNIHIQEKS
jgi:hypothetical protein